MQNDRPGFRSRRYLRGSPTIPRLSDILRVGQLPQDSVETDWRSVSAELKCKDVTLTLLLAAIQDEPSRRLRLHIRRRV